MKIVLTLAALFLSFVAFADKEKTTIRYEKIGNDTLVVIETTAGIMTNVFIKDKPLLEMNSFCYLTSQGTVVKNVTSISDIAYKPACGQYPEVLLVTFTDSDSKNFTALWAKDGENWELAGID